MNFFSSSALTDTLIAAIIAFSIPILIASIVVCSIKIASKKANPRKRKILQFIASCTNIIGFSLALVSALGTIGIDVSVLIAGLGLTGLGLSLALKDLISNFVAGIMLIIYDPFNIDSTIKVGDSVGKVIQMDLRYVYIKTQTDTALIPNSTFLTTTVKIIADTELNQTKES